MEHYVPYHKCHISMGYLQSYVEIELMRAYHHICYSSSVMTEWSFMYVVTRHIFMAHLQIYVGMEVICVYITTDMRVVGPQFFPVS